MIEFRWVILLALWTLFIGPVIDLTQHAPTAPQRPQYQPIPATVRSVQP